jgi:CBS domain containing-hemolysin-like protein
MSTMVWVHMLRSEVRLVVGGLVSLNFLQLLPRSLSFAGPEVIAETVNAVLTFIPYALRPAASWRPHIGHRRCAMGAGIQRIQSAAP